MPLGKVAAKKIQNGDFMNSLSFSAKQESNQLRFTGPGPIKSQSLVQDADRKFIQPDPSTRTATKLSKNSSVNSEKGKFVKPDPSTRK